MDTRAFTIALAVTFASMSAAASASAQDLQALREGQLLEGFRVRAVYRDGAGDPLGARFVHERSGFTLDLLRMETAPQAFTWVNTYLVSDMGEPHTQEHLLLGKGNVGRAAANLESYSLVGSSAFVTQWRTQYHFNAPAGPGSFFTVLESQLHALLNPDYTDEEIRREVRNIGIAEDPDGRLRLEEKGTVYQEMVSSFERAGSRLFREMAHALYGADHPLAMSAGGWPAAIREMTPGHIRAFHRATYQLGNMGTVVALPRAETLVSVLARTDAVLSRLPRDEAGARRPFRSGADLPEPSGLSEGAVRFAEYPHRNPEQPSPLLFAWPPTRSLSLGEETLLSLFLQNVAGDATTNLYRIFVDARSRSIDLGAQGVSAWVSSDQGHPVFVQLSDVAPSRAAPERLEQARDRILEELRTIAGWADGAAELTEFNDRLRARVIETRREMASFASSPPGFGLRGTGNRWVTHLDRLAREPGFVKSVTLAPELDGIERMLERGTNVWREALEGWGLLTGLPHVALARPSPDLVEREDRERRERLVRESEHLTRRFGVVDPQEAIRRYAAEYDRETARLNELEASTTGRFLERPPLGLDEALDHEVVPVGEAGMPTLWARFQGVPRATAGLALRMDAVPDEELSYLALLPALLTQVGVIRDGVVVPFTEMRNRLREEILSLNAYYSVNPHTGRVELMLRGAGNDAAEAELALGWIAAALYGPDWRPENLPRIRDVVDQGLAGLRATTARAEENWVDDPALAYRYETDHLYLAAASFQTRIHAAYRLRWRLRTAPEGEASALDAALADLGRRGEGLDREELRGLLRAAGSTGDGGATGNTPAATGPSVLALSAEATTLFRDAAGDLELTLADLPDGSLANDFADLVGRMRADLAMPPGEVLAALHRVRERILTASSTRAFLVSSPQDGDRLQRALAQATSGLRNGPAPSVDRDAMPLVRNRLRQRDPTAGEILFVGLVNPNTQGGVFLNTVPMAGYRTRDPESILDFLAAQIYAGGGAHSMFMKTWAAGLAYSNGLRNSPATGLLTYYAERVPELPQTMRFVIDELRASPHDPGLTEYAVAMAFRGIRSAQTYEARAESMANDLADDLGPDVVREFLTEMLARRDREDLAEEIYARMERVYGQVLPGYGPASASVDGGVFFVIGPESQLRLYEEYLRGAEGQEIRLYRLHGRDFWLRN